MSKRQKTIPEEFRQVEMEVYKNESADQQQETGEPPRDNDGNPVEQFRQLLRDWVWVVSMERFVNINDAKKQWKTSQFDSRYNKVLRVSSISRLLFQNSALRTCDSAIYRPGEPRFITETLPNDDGTKRTVTLFNLWRPSPVVPKKGDTRLWDEHMEKLFPDAPTRNAVLDWMAWTYQNQFARPEIALLIIGKVGGTGKSTVARVFESIIGVENTERPKKSSIEGDFNPWAMSKLIIAEELKNYTAAGKREVAHQLRDIISEPWIEINLKGISQFKIENYCALIALSNYPDAVQLVENERRWLVVEVLITEKEKTESLGPDGSLTKLWKWLDPDNKRRALRPAALAAIAWQLKQRDVSKFKPGAAIMTAAKEEMILRSKAPLEQAVIEYIESSRRTIHTMGDILDGIPVPVKSKMPGNYKTIIGDLLRSDRFKLTKKQVRAGGRNAGQLELWVSEDDYRKKTPGKALRERYNAEAKAEPTKAEIEFEEFVEAVEEVEAAEATVDPVEAAPDFTEPAEGEPLE